MSKLRNYRSIKYIPNSPFYVFPESDGPYKSIIIDDNETSEVYVTVSGSGTISIDHPRECRPEIRMSVSINDKIIHTAYSDVYKCEDNKYKYSISGAIVMDGLLVGQRNTVSFCLTSSYIVKVTMSNPTDHSTVIVSYQ